MMWDLREKEAPVVRTPLLEEGVHFAPIYSMGLVGTEHSHNVVTSCEAGRVCVWSLSMFSKP